MPRRPLSRDQKRALVIMLVIVLVIVLLAFGIAWLALSLGAPAWLAIVVAVIVTAALGLFMLLELA